MESSKMQANKMKKRLKSSIECETDHRRRNMIAQMKIKMTIVANSNIVIFAVI